MMEINLHSKIYNYMHSTLYHEIRPDHAIISILFPGSVITKAMVDRYSDSFLIGGYLTSICGRLREKRKLFPNLRNLLQKKPRNHLLNLPRQPPSLQPLQLQNLRLLSQTLQNLRRQPSPQRLQRDPAARPQELKNHPRAESSII